MSNAAYALDWTHPRGRAWLVRRDDGTVWKFMCPGCGLVGEVDLDQVQGRVSINCPQCLFHETLAPKVIAGPMAVAEEDVIHYHGCAARAPGEWHDEAMQSRDWQTCEQADWYAPGGPMAEDWTAKT